MQCCIGSSGQVTWTKRSEMPYTCAFMEEVFRFKTLVALGVQHLTTEDAEIGGYYIPKGTMVRDKSDDVKSLFFWLRIGREVPAIKSRLTNLWIIWKNVKNS